MLLARRLLEWNFDLEHLLVGTYRTWSETFSSTSFMSMTRVQNEKGTARGIDARRKDLPRCAMTIMVSDC